MRLYEGSSTEFIDLTVHNTISNRLKSAYRGYYHRDAGPSEVTSWTNSLQFLKNVVERNSLMDNMVVLEFELPYCPQRIDCLLFGRGGDSSDNVVVIELKQWTKVELSNVEGNIVTLVGGANRIEPHPSAQVRGYHFMLKDFMELFNDGSTGLHSCAYCHNYSKIGDSPLLAENFREILREFPLFSKEDFESFGKYLRERLSGGGGLEIFNRFVVSPIGPSKKLLSLASQMIAGQTVFTLVDEQIIANNAIVDRAKKAARAARKSVILVRGGPGTGKSVIALNVLAELASHGKSVFHATGSKSFTDTLRKIAGPRAKVLFNYFNSYGEKKVKENNLDLLICDEAHRIRKTSNRRYTRAAERSTMPQAEELVRAAKVTVFFIDDNQVVRPEEVGSSKLIREAAKKFDAEVFDFELKTQFRCSGSNGYLEWIDGLLGIGETSHAVLTKGDKMDFKIAESPEALLDFVRQQNAVKPNSARMVAGFCWPWSPTKSDGTLVEDVAIGNFKMPWEGRDDPHLAKGIPRWFEWAYDPAGVSQCGCIYTVQGFEFDFVGVIFGDDYVYIPEMNRWVGKMDKSKDPFVKKGTKTEEEFAQYVRNIYRVLLTRGMKGCHVYFVDKATEEFVRGRIEDGGRMG